MDEGLGAIAAIVGLVGLTFRLVQFVCGLGWLFSRNYRERVARDHPSRRWIVYEGVFYAVLVAALALVGIGGVLLPQFAGE